MHRFTKNQCKELGHRIDVYYREKGRHLPWRDQGDFYSVWLSEIMSQQTRLEVVVDYYLAFKEALPRIEDLAQVDEGRLLKLWEGLGYYTRARNLKAAAQTLVGRGGSLPDRYEDLLALPGIGPYTASAIMSMVYFKPYVALDGNLMRVFSRLLAYEGDISKAKSKKDLEAFGLEIMGDDPSAFNQGLMDLASAVCKPKGQALCWNCPLRDFCQAYKLDRVEDFPVKAKKKPRRRVKRTLFILSKGARLGLNQRPSRGLLSGQWQLPGVDQDLDLEEAKALLLEKDLPYKEVFEGPSYKHIFSHVEWHIKSYLVTIRDLPLAQEDGLSYYSIEEIEKELALASAFKPLVEEWIHHVSK